MGFNTPLSERSQVLQQIQEGQQICTHGERESVVSLNLRSVICPDLIVVAEFVRIPQRVRILTNPATQAAIYLRAEMVDREA
jgi:hypothetical protein